MTNPQVPDFTAAAATEKPGWTPEARVRFLDCLARRGNVRLACATAGVSHEAAYRLRRRDAMFDAGWQAALVLAREVVEQVLADRAIDGVEEPVFYRGEEIGMRRRYDSRLLLAHLARLDRAAEETQARYHAGRFDELLARIGGVEPPQGLPAAHDGSPLLPPEREAFCTAAEDDAECQLAWSSWGRDKSRCAEMKTGYEVHDPDAEEDREDDNEDNDLLAARWSAFTESEAIWNEWHDSALAQADALIGAEGVAPIEYKSLVPPVFHAGTTDWPESKSPEDRVNLSTTRRLFHPCDKRVGYLPTGPEASSPQAPERRRLAMKTSRLLAGAALAAVVLAPAAALAAPVKLTATLSGANETAGGDPHGSGGFTATVDPETNDFCYSLWGDKIGKPTAAHVHTGAAGSDGAPVAMIEVTGKDNDECMALDKEKLQPIVDNPAGFYVNIHTADFPKGALRGQLVKQ